jgi:hypothetical protein
MRSNEIKSEGCDLSRKALVSAAQPSAEKFPVNFLLFTGRLETALPMVVRKITPRHILI